MPGMDAVVLATRFLGGGFGSEVTLTITRDVRVQLAGVIRR